MTTSYQAKVPTAAADYFHCGTKPPYDEHPIVAQVFRPGRGWTRYPWRKRVSGAWARKTKAEGVTAVALRYHGRLADFTIAELTR